MPFLKSFYFYKKETPYFLKIKPIQIALFMIFLLGGLFGLMFLSQKGVIQNNRAPEDGFAVEGVSVKYPTYKTFLQLEKDTSVTRNDIVKVTKTVQPIEEEPEDDLEIVSELPTKKDSLQRPDFSKIDTTQIVRIRYPDSNPDFVAELQEKLSSRNCRIIHYGDSQLEGDRITAYLRNRLQRMYGGSGPGFIPLLPVYRQISASIEPSKNWKRYAFFDPTQKKEEHKKYGLYLTYSRFTEYYGETIDSTLLDSLPVVQASVIIGKSNKSYAKLRKFSNIGLHYGNAQYPIKISVYDNEKLIKQDSLISDGNYHEYKIRTASTPDNLRIQLEGKVSADFYGLTLDGISGIKMDNVAMRGASGTIFARTKALTYSRMANTLDPKIMILQYGGNTVPYLKDSTEVDNYAKYIKGQINWIRRRTKDVSFIFIGPTDMCIPINGKMQTYPLLPYLNKKLMETSLENNVAYWSMYDAMGGKGSMQYWVDEKLAAGDYTHFTWSGTKIISELFFTALYLDLKKEEEHEL